MLKKSKNIPSSCLKKNEVCANAHNIRSEKEDIRSQVLEDNLGSEYICGENDFSDSISENESEENSASDSPLSHYLTKEEKLKNKLKKIFVTHNVSVSLCNDILGALREYGINLPLSRNGLFSKKCSTNNVSPAIKNLEGGQYLHVGIEANTIRCNEKEILEADEITIDVEIDRLMLSSHSLTLKLKTSVKDQAFSHVVVRISSKYEWVNLILIPSTPSHIYAFI